MVAAWLLHGDHDLTVFEASSTPGGHTNTVDVPTSSGPLAIDTGFIVFNDWTYPGFIALLERLGVASQPSDMSFSVRDAQGRFEYCGSTLNALFAQRSNLLKPRFWWMVRDILRFNREARQLVSSGDDATTLGEWLDRGRYSSWFVERYLLPMGGAIWSAEASRMRTFPARAFASFFENHGMLSVDERPQWRTVSGGSRSYLRAITSTYADRIRSSTPVTSVRRFATHVEVTPRGGAPETFDQVVVATHSDQALALLADASDLERDVLGAIPYQRNVAVLHTDARVMPRRKLAWASWNYHLGADVEGSVGVTYWMNRLQDLRAEEDYFVTLNDVAAIDPARVLRRIEYHHPVFTTRGIAAQKRWAEINGTRRTWFCGAYWANGFHEDGLQSGLRVAAQFGKKLSDGPRPRVARATEVATA